METIIGLLEQSVGSHQHKAAMRQKVGGVWQETTYRELWEVSDRVAAGLLKAGFKVGDQLDSFRGSSIDDLGDFRRAIVKTRPNDEVKAILRRGDDKKTVMITLGKGL